jgi:hypothetical protein
MPGRDPWTVTNWSHPYDLNAWKRVPMPLQEGMSQSLSVEPVGPALTFGDRLNRQEVGSRSEDLKVNKSGQSSLPIPEILTQVEIHARRQNG